MKKTNTSNTLKLFNDNKDKAYKKANGEMAAFKKSLPRAQDGTEFMDNPPDSFGPPSFNLANPYINPKPLGVNLGIGNFSGGFKGDIGNNKISNSIFNAGYNNTKTGLGINASYRPENKNFSGGINYTTTIGKNKTPLKLGVTYNKKGGATNATKKK